YGNDPTNWVAATATPGGPRSTGGAPPLILTQPSSQTALATSTAVLSVDALGTGPLRFQWQRNGHNLAGPTNPNLIPANLDGAQPGQYAVLVYNQAGSAVSSNASLQVLYGPFLLQPPGIVQLRGSTNNADYGFTTNNATFSVVAVGTGQLHYQWRYNGVEMP